MSPPLPTVEELTDRSFLQVNLDAFLVGLETFSPPNEARADTILPPAQAGRALGQHPGCRAREPLACAVALLEASQHASADDLPLLAWPSVLDGRTVVPIVTLYLVRSLSCVRHRRPHGRKSSLTLTSLFG